MCYARGASASPVELCDNTHSTPSLVCHETVRSVCSAHHICLHNISYRQFLEPIAAPLNADVHLSRLAHCDDPKIKAYCVRTLKNMTTSDSADVSRVRGLARQGYFCYFTSCSSMAHFCFICSVPDVGILLPLLFSPQALEEGAVANLIAMSLEVDLAPFSPLPYHFLQSLCPTNVESPHLHFYLPHTHMQGKEKTVFQEKLSEPDILPCVMVDEDIPQGIHDLFCPEMWFEEKVQTLLLTSHLMSVCSTLL